MKCRALSRSKRNSDKMSRLDRIIYEKAKEEVERQKVKRGKIFDSVVLLTIHQMEDYGKQRLEKFYKTFIDTYNEIEQKYEMGEATITKLREITGVDMDDLYAKYVDDNAYDNPMQAKLTEQADEIEYLTDENKILKEQVRLLMEMQSISAKKKVV